MKLFTQIIRFLKLCNNILFSILSGLHHVVSLIRSRPHFKSSTNVEKTVTHTSKREEDIMITANQVAYWSLQEQIRSNQAREDETERSNRAKEDQAAVEAKETHRANVAKESETHRHNINTEILDFSDSSLLAMGVAAGLQAGKGLFEGSSNVTDSNKQTDFTSTSSEGGGGHSGRAGKKRGK